MPVKNILVIRFSSLGDLITMDIVFKAIRFFYKDAKISFLTSHIGKDLYSESDYFDEYIIASGSNFLEVANALRQQEFDIVFNFHCNSQSFLLSLFINSKLFLYQSYKWWQKLFRVNVKSKPYPEMLQLSGIDTDKIDAYLKQNGVSTVSLPFKPNKHAWQGGSQKIVAIAPGTSKRWKSKKWGDEKYGELSELLIQKGYKVILIGSNLEKTTGKSIEKKYPSVINLIAKTTLAELKSILARVDLLVTNDSGPAHLAAGVGTNTLTIFGSTDIKHCVKFGNYGGTHEYLVSSPLLECQPCYKSKCPTRHECMGAITPNQVMEKISNTFGDNS